MFLGLKEHHLAVRGSLDEEIRGAGSGNSAAHHGDPLGHGNPESRSVTVGRWYMAAYSHAPALGRNRGAAVSNGAVSWANPGGRSSVRLEHLVVVQDVGGSNPLGHPIGPDCRPVASAAAGSIGDR